MTKRRIIFTAGVGAIASGALIAIFLSIAVGTGWLGRLLCERIVSGLQSATGGGVAVRSTHFDWRHLTAELDGLSIRRTDVKDAAPFLRADEVRLQFGIVSVLRREVDLASLVIVRPKFDFTLAPGAVSNAARLGRSAVRLRIHRFQVVQGVFQAGLGKFNVTVRGEDLNASVALESARPRYDIALSAQRLRVGSVEGSGSVRAQFEAGRLTIDHLSFSDGADTLQASGLVQFLAHPVADFSVHAHMSLGGAGSQHAASRLFGTHAPDAGQIDLSAKVHYDPRNSWAIHGTLSGRQIGRFRGLPLKNVSFDSDLSWKPGVARFSHATVSALGGTLSGTAIVRNDRDLDFDGAVAGVRIREAVLLITRKPLDWAGAATGRIHFTDVLKGGAPDFKISAAVRISPLTGKLPVAGNLQFVYRSRGAAIAFSNCRLHLPHTQAAFSGTPRGILRLTLETDNTDDLAPVLAFAPVLKAALPTWLENAGFRFSGQIAGAAVDPQLQGSFALDRAAWAEQAWGPVRGHLILSRSAAEFSNVTAGAGALHASGMARIGLENWAVRPESVLRLKARFAGVDLGKALANAPPKKLRVSAGSASGSIDVSGSVASPSGTVQIGARGMIVDGERLDSADVTARLDRNRLRIEHARFAAGAAFVTASGVYERAANLWNSGNLRVRVDSSGFPIGKLLPIRPKQSRDHRERSNRFFRSFLGLAADLQVHGVAAARIVNGKIEPTNADGVLTFRNISLNGVHFGSAKVVASTSGASVQAKLSGEIRHAPVSGTLRIDVAPGTPAKGELHLGRISLAAVATLIHPASADPLPVAGWMEGGVDFDGPLEYPERMHALAHIDRLEVRAKLPATDAGTKANHLTIRNVGALVFEIENGVATVRSFHLGGQDTGIAVLGIIPCSADKPMNLTVGGSAGLRIFELFDSRVQASGQSLVSASVRGKISDPVVEGTLEIKNGAFFLNNVPNGLTAVNGTVSFDRNRATIGKLTAQSGGGKLNLGGFVSFGSGGPLVYNVEASAQNVRIQPAGSVSITANGSLRLSGTSDNSVLGGSVSVSHIVLNANSDLAGLLTSVSAPVPSPGNAKDFISGLQFDVHVVSAPNLQLSSSLGRDLEAEIDLRLRGTPNQPVLLGTISADQGEVKMFGTSYTINHADVHFTNPVEIEPAVDLDLQTRAHGVTVNITVTGSLSKLNINYRSDPPLQPRDIIALLAVGETPGTAATVVNAPTAAETAALESSANTVLGQAITPESGRLSKLFGITNIKIDPLAQGSTVTP
ncbi:MAG: translocation/assembly module TamB domain-containing protein, partial [Bryobacteraceae bacterium]